MGYQDRQGDQELRSFGGLNVGVGELKIDPAQSPDLMNVDLHPVGVLKKRPGYAVMSAAGVAGDGQAFTIFEGLSSAGVNYYYAHRGSKVFRATSISGPWVDATAAVTLTVDDDIRLNMIQGRHLTTNAVFMTNGNRKPLIATMNSTLASDLIEWPAGAYGSGSGGTKGYPTTWVDDWPTAMSIVNFGLGADAQRCFAWGFEGEPERIDYSEMGNLTNFLWTDVTYDPSDANAVAQVELDGGSFYVGRGDGDVIVNVIDMFGYYVVFKKKRIFVLTGDAASATFQVVATFDSGCLSRRSVKRIGNDVLFWSKIGPSSLAFVREKGNITTGDINFEIRPDATGIIVAAHDEIVAYHDPANARAFWFFPAEGSSTNNKAIIPYYDVLRWTRYQDAYTEIADVLVVSEADSADQLVYAIRYDGSVVQLATGTLDGEAQIEAHYVTSWMNFGNISDASRSLWLDMMIGDGGNDGLVIEMQQDLATAWREVADPVKGYGSSGSRWGSIVWGDFIWGATGRAYIRYDMSALFNLVRMKFSSTTAGNFEVMGYKVEARAKGARP